MWASAILGALKALPLIAESISELSILIKNVQDDILDKHIEDIKETNAKILKQIEKAQTDEQLKKLLRDLNRNLNT